MDRVTGILGYAGTSVKPEILVFYGLFAVLVTVLVNWVFATLFFMLKPFTCAAILLAFIRPDLAQNFLQEDGLKVVGEKSKSLIFGIVQVFLKMGQEFRQRFES